MIEEIPRDKLSALSDAELYLCQHQKRFHVREICFENNGEGEFSCGPMKVFHDQQCSTAWRATVGGLITGVFPTPQEAVERLLNTLETASQHV